MQIATVVRGAGHQRLQLVARACGVGKVSRAELFRKCPREESTAHKYPVRFPKARLFSPPSRAYFSTRQRVAFLSGDAVRVEQACLGWGTDQRKLLDILCNRSKEQLEEIARKYEVTFGKTLQQVLKSELSGFFEGKLSYLVQLLLTPAGQIDQNLLHGAIAGWGTKDGQLIELLGTRSASELKLLARLYQERHGTTLRKAVAGDTSGQYRQLLLAYIDAIPARNEGAQVDEMKVFGAVTAIHDGLDSEDPLSAFVAFLPEASELEVGALVRAYAATVRRYVSQKPCARQVSIGWSSASLDVEFCSYIYGMVSRDSLELEGGSFARWLSPAHTHCDRIRYAKETEIFEFRQRNAGAVPGRGAPGQARHQGAPVRLHVRDGGFFQEQRRFPLHLSCVLVRVGRVLGPPTLFFREGKFLLR